MSTPFAPASIKRRMASVVYESFLLFGVIFITGFIFDTLTHSRDPLTLRHVRQLILFLASGGYCVFCWRRKQTLDMKTWHIQVVNLNHQTISFKQAVLRYCFSWMWFLPALLFNMVFNLHGAKSIIAIVIGVCLWALLANLNKHKQFLHDVLAGTMIICTKPPSTAHQKNITDTAH